MKILFVGMYPDEHNCYRNVFFQNLIYAMADMGIECTVISPVPITKYRKAIVQVSKERIDSTPGGNKVRVFHPRYISLSNKKICGFNTGRITEKLFQRATIRVANRLTDSFDVVYGHFILAGGLAAIRIGRRMGIPSFFAYGECNYDTEVISSYGEIKEEEISGLSGIIAVSTNNAGVLSNKHAFKKISMIIAPNSVDLSLFYKRDKEQCRKELGLPLDKFIVGFVGGFVERKGDKRLLEAINQIQDVYVAFAGRGNPQPEGEKVLFCQALDHTRIPVFLNAIDVFCLPTLNEGSCNAIVEAAACGLPIISSDLPFNDDILDDTNSIRIDPNNIEEIKKAIHRLYTDKELRQTLAKEAQKKGEGLSIEQRAIRILDFIWKESHQLQ